LNHHEPHSEDEYFHIITGSAGLYDATWPNLHIDAHVEAVREGARNSTIEADVTFTSRRVSGPGHLRHARLTLGSQSGKDSYIRSLKKREPLIDFDTVVEQLCVGIIRRYREGSPVVKSQANEDVDSLVDWHVSSLIDTGSSSLIFAPGGSGKSWFCQLITIMVANGIDHVGLRVRQCPVLYLDWETTQTTFERRMTMIRKGLGIGKDEYDNVYYRQMSRPFVNDTVEITAQIRKHGIGLIVVDSMGLASGGRQNDDDTIIELTRAMSGVSEAVGGNLSKLIIDHPAKMPGEGGKASPYGSGYKVTWIRNMFQLRKDEVQGKKNIAVGLFHEKTNDAPRLEDQGFEINFETPGQVKFFRREVPETPGLEQYQSWRQRCLTLLKEYPEGLTPVEASDLLGASLAQIRKEFSNGANDRNPDFVLLKDGMGKSLGKYVLAHYGYDNPPQGREVWHI